MTRITASFLLLSVLALSKASLLVRADEGVTSGCVINTPKEITPRVGKDFKITWSGCKGHGRIQVRSGDPKNLDEDDDYACELSNMADKDYCYWVPKKEGTFSLSVIDDSGVESFTAKFQVEGGHNKVKRGFGGRAKANRRGGRGKHGGRPKHVKFGHPKVEKIEKVLHPRSERDDHPKIKKDDHHKIEKVVDHHKVEKIDHGHPKVEKVEKVIYPRSERDEHPKIEKDDHHQVQKVEHPKIEKVGHPKVEKKPEHEAHPDAPRRRSLPLRL
ncbi:hypothetical protein EMPS_00413 [Entomortierella parvispora]|uniref:Uncharacterized protein n=1 Tax=Entomortierella parvispora TaxID=205924 RepID=A0A9P3H131_9FUNG|nr:hypothetical protein EMPS_00413 [Entomortierella parvispora]